MHKQPITLLDCDDVMGDFHGAALGFINQRTGKNYTRDDVTEWDIFEALDHKELEPELDAAIELDEFCLNIPVMPGVKEALKELRTMSTVICLTAPHHTLIWPGHRSRWLEENLGFDKRHRVSTHAKYGYYGDVFVDDNGPNVSLWKKFWMEMGLDNTGVVFDKLYNKHHVDENLVRVASWDEIVTIVEEKARRFG